MQIIYWILLTILTAVSLPFLVVITIIIAVTEGVPVIFSQKRVGKEGIVFIMYKFRTMVNGAQKLQKKYEHLNEAHGPVFKLYNDPRYTPIGKFLAHTGLDELPQLYNVLRGDMALFGPRPLPGAEERQLKKWQKIREQLKPGIISPWVVEGYHRTPFDAWMKSDIAYINKKSFYYDFRLTVRTIRFLILLLKKELLGS